MKQYEIKLEGWVTDTVFVTAIDKAEAIKIATQELINRKGVENCRADIVELEENMNDYRTTHNYNS